MAPMDQQTNPNPEPAEQAPAPQAPPEQEQTPASASAQPPKESEAPETRQPDDSEIEQQVSELLKDEFGDDDAFASAFRQTDKAREEAPADAQQEAAPQTQQPAESEQAPAEAEQTPEEQQAPAFDQPTTQEQPAQQPDVENLQASAEQLQQALYSYRQQAEEQLATNLYALSAEEVQAIDEDPAEFLKTQTPKVLARVHLEAQLAAMMQMARLMPTVMRQVSQTQQQSDQLEGKFFERWPQLKEHYNEVMRIGQLYRQVNPQAKPEDFIETVGLQTALQLKLPVQGQQQPVQQQPQRQQPFEPVAARAGVAPNPQTQQPQNEFEQLAVEEMQEMGIPMK